MQDRLSPDEYALYTDIRLWLGDHGHRISHNTLTALVRSLRGHYHIQWIKAGEGFQYHVNDGRLQGAVLRP